MALPGYIPNHYAQAIERLLQQYKDQPKMYSILESFVAQIQDLEDAFKQLYELRTIQTGEGQVLDDIGTIVGQPRLGFDDVRYKTLLLAKIGQNTSQADLEKIRQIALLLIDASLVDVQEWFPAGIGIYASNDIPLNLVNFFYGILNLVDAAGVRLEALICFDEDEAFAFEGNAGNALGFGDSTNPATGGMFAKMHVPTLPALAFAPGAGVENDDEGFGTLDDNLYGGIFQGV